jgi:hypothetical protein
VEPNDAPHEAPEVPQAALEVVPTRLGRLELERVARIAEAPRTRGETAQAYQTNLIDDMPSLRSRCSRCRMRARILSQSNEEIGKTDVGNNNTGKVLLSISNSP